MTKNKVALITGSSRGIGKGNALALADNDWHMVIHYQNNKQAADDYLPYSTGEVINIDGGFHVQRL